VNEETRKEEAQDEAATAGQPSASIAVAFEWACRGFITTHISGDRGYDVYSVFVTLPDCSTYRGSSRAGYAQALRNAYKQFAQEAKAQRA
jgi:hypothetical protein